MDGGAYGYYRQIKDEDYPVGTERPVPFQLPESVVFRIIWRIISEVFGVVSARRCNTSQTGHPTKMTAKSDTYPVG